mmetsp:Transcript_29593/g.62766  ORF Transcript_29593/g.62766 Transcript_29593/m.62766 type:complete len:244 (+) Transcript_29593:79-810(+)|eukprot:CAMPEP_0172317028 /NCGR_PEP_ID=MMETSP1058-20130122/30310_1 /TAXON_ID=83371 /ORGANISM="Detonula confervacea, Strain CCMP 353" /LENGTH=243 /DNA_ID=CAMNT_0013031481 /DNA_START=27 /DNA_END=758 /DNA_ORIENTATION=-
MKPGTKVRIKGLVKAAHHNDKVGVVTKAIAPGEARVGVKLSDGTVLAVKTGNLEVLLVSNNDDASTDQKMATSKSISDSMPKQRTLKREHALLREFDGNPDPNTLALYYHLADRAFDAYNAPEYNGQMMRYYEKGLSVRIVLSRRIGSNEYFLVGLQHAEHEKNALCEMAFNCGRSFLGISILVKKRCFKCNKPGVLQCERCLCACFCSDICKKSDIGRDHEKLCKQINLSNILVEDECVQLL